MTPLTAQAQSIETRTAGPSDPVDSQQLATVLRSNDQKADTIDRAFLDGRVADARRKVERILCKTVLASPVSG
jgi:hypothetical protein